jgi:hypothetical protein
MVLLAGRSSADHQRSKRAPDGRRVRLSRRRWHAIFHLLTGAILLSVCLRPSLAYRAVLGFVLAYAVVAIAGVVDGQDVFGVIPVDGRDNLVHSVYVSLALGVLVLGRPARRAEMISSAA